MCGTTLTITQVEGVYYVSTLQRRQVEQHWLVLVVKIALVSPIANVPQDSVCSIIADYNADVCTSGGYGTPYKNGV